MAALRVADWRADRVIARLLLFSLCGTASASAPPPILSLIATIFLLLRLRH